MNIGIIILLIFMAAIITSAIYILTLPAQITRKMRLKFEDIKKSFDKDFGLENNSDEIISQYPQIKEALGGRDLTSFITEVKVERIHNYLEFLTTIDGWCEMSPNIWWKDRYRKELQSLRKEARDLSREIKNLI